MARRRPRPDARRPRPPRGDLAGSRAIGGERPLDLRLRRLPVRHREADRGPSVPDRAAHPHLAALLHAPEDVARALVVLVAEQDLVQDDVVEDLGAGLRNAGRERARTGAAPVDDLGDAVAAERPERGVDGEPTRPAGELGRPVELVARASLVLLHEIRSRDAHRGPVRRRVRAEGDAAVVGDVQPLVRVGRPRVRPLGASRQVAQRRARGGPEPERAVHVQPRPGGLRGVGDRREVVAGAGVDLADLRADDRRPVVELERVDRHPPLVVGRDHLGRAHSEQPQGPVDGDVTPRANDDAHRRRAVQPVVGDVPAALAEDVEPRGGEGRHVRDLAPRHEAERRRRWQPEQLQQPRAGDLLDDGGGGAADVEPGVLIPRRRQPVRRECGGEGAADHEAEVAARRDRDRPAVGGSGEVGNDLARRRRSVGEPAAERVAQLVERRRRPHRPLLERLEEIGGDVGGEREQVAELAHGPDSTTTTPRAASDSISAWA